MSTLRKILLALVAIIVIFLIVVLVQPSEFRVARTAKIEAPPSIVFEQVNSFKNWPAWSPWEKIDPNMTRTYEGPDSGKDAAYAWTGNDKVGQGKMTIVESKPGELVRINLDFIKPFPSPNNDVEFAFKPEGSGTEVTWSMAGKKNFMMKAFGLFMNMDSMIGSEYEKGLAEMKKVAEEKAKGK